MLAIKFVLVLVTVAKVFAEFSAKAWQSSKDYPEPSDFPEVALLKDRPNTAIAFTGGGSRAYTAAIGYLAGLHKLDLLKNVRYVGGISGGAWATSTFSFVQNVDDDDIFLGPVLNPEDFSLEKLKKMDDNCARRLTDTDLTALGLKAWARGEVNSVAGAWAYGVTTAYLTSVGVTPGKYFSWNEKSVSEILSKNSHLTAADFTTVKLNRPFPIIGTALVGPAEGAPYTHKNQNYTLLEITPLYIGQMRTLDVSYEYTRGIRHTRRVGGMVEPFAWSDKGAAPSRGLLPHQTTGLLSIPEPTKAMDIGTSAAASSYAPGSFVEAFHPKDLANALGMHFDYWSPSAAIPSAKDTLFTDGGAYENIVLISYLQRRVSRIILFFNDHTPLAPANKYNPSTDTYTGDQLSDSLTCFFGVLPEPMSKFENRSFEYERDQVFHRNDFPKVVSALQAAQAKGDGIFATLNLTTIDNNWWGIPAGITTEITFAYLGRIPAWEAKLPHLMKPLFVPWSNAEDLSNDIDHGSFRKFPHYATTGGEINAERANALADLTGWSVLHNADLFRRVLQ
jgi:hypothetical protein